MFSGAGDMHITDWEAYRGLSFDNRAWLRGPRGIARNWATKASQVPSKIIFSQGMTVDRLEQLLGVGPDTA